LKGYNARHLVRVSQKKLKMSAASTNFWNSYGLLVGRLSSRQWQVAQHPHWSCWWSGVTQKWLVKK